ncbi:hypothetical protein [Sphingobacterium lumbrici]|nr:hypothetical protein [Sphingobacterium lumbrici]
MSKYKRDYRYKSNEGNNGDKFKWLIVAVGVIIALLAYFLK